MEEILAGGGVEGGVFLDDFQRDIAMEDFVKCAVDDAHSAFANLFGNAVMADDLTDQGRVPPRNMLMRAWRCVNEAASSMSAKVWRSFSLNFILSISGFVSTNPEPRFVTIHERQTEPGQAFRQAQQKTISKPASITKTAVRR